MNVELGARIAIMGKGRGWRKGLTKRHAGFELWGLNDPDDAFGPNDADRWFQLHSEEYLEKHWQPMWAVSAATWRRHWRASGKTPLYMQRHYDDLSGSVEFPKARIEAELPMGRYHCGSFDWMVTFALLYKPAAIHLYGVALWPLGEPLSARSCLEYWLGVAAGRGIEIYVDGGDLFSTLNIVQTDWQYAWDESRPIINKTDALLAIWGEIEDHGGVEKWIEWEKSKDADRR